jgi:hypothetical protein
MRSSFFFSLICCCSAAFTSNAQAFQDAVAQEVTEPTVKEIKLKVEKVQPVAQEKTAAAPAAQENAKPETAKPRFGSAEENKVEDGKIYFTFNEQSWKDVIPWFAEQAGYTLQRVDDWPEGVFSLADKEEYTTVDALDELIRSLRLIKPEPYTLVRNRNKLYLVKLADASLPEDLIERVSVDDLESRAKYETMKCIFELEDLNAEELSNQLMPQISEQNRRHFAVFPAGNQIIIRETGANLRTIKRMIDAARQRKNAGETGLYIYRLQHMDAETFMPIIRGLVGMPVDVNIRDDRELTIAVEPFGDRLFVQGTDEWLEKFKSLSQQIDMSGEEAEIQELDEPRLKTYAVMVDPANALKVLDTMLAERDGVRMAQDEKTGAITILGRDEDHDLAQSTLDTLSGHGAEDFALIQLENGDPAEIIMALQSLFRQTPEDSSGPVLLGNADKGQIIVRGTPQEVVAVKNYVSQFDANSIPVETGPRTSTRIIELNPRQQEDVLPMLDALLGSMGRRNKLNIVEPEDRKNFRERFPTPSRLLELDPGTEAAPVIPANQGSRIDINRFFQSEPFVVAAAALAGPQLFATSVLPFQEEVGQTTDESDQNRRAEGYIPPPRIDSVPGDPIKVRMTDFGFILESNDLDALDDLEYAIGQRVDVDSVDEAPFFFRLKYRPANDVMAWLETYFGVADSGGGGGGGNLMSNMMSNMMGGGDDLLGGLLGGSDSGGGTGTLEGDVQFGVDMKFNTLYVRGATSVDLDEIVLLIEMLDQPEAPHDPDVLGVTRTIDVIHRDAAEVKDLVQAQLSDLIDTGEDGGQKNQANEMANMAKMMQQLTGGGRKGGGGSSEDYEKEKPKAKLDVDVSTSQLLVTGPEFIFKKIQGVVLKLDKPELSEPPDFLLLNPAMDKEKVKATLKAIFGSKIEVKLSDEVGGQESGQNNATRNRTTSGNQDAASKAMAQGQDAARQAIMRAMQQRQTQQGGAQRGGGTQRGGGGQRGGGRGGR